MKIHANCRKPHIGDVYLIPKWNIKFKIVNMDDEFIYIISLNNTLYGFNSIGGEAKLISAQIRQTIMGEILYEN